MLELDDYLHLRSIFDWGILLLLTLKVGVIEVGRVRCKKKRSERIVSASIIFHPLSFVPLAAFEDPAAL